MMTEPINVLALMPFDALNLCYNELCEEYRRRLCEMWNFPFEESWWVSDEIGGQLFIADWWLPLDMQQLRYVVENNVAEKAWLEYCDFVESEIHEGRKYPRINFDTWFKRGIRPKISKDDGINQKIE